MLFGFKITAICVGLLWAVSFASPANAQSSDQRWRQCFPSDRVADTPERRIRACSDLVASGSTEPIFTRSRAFDARGYAYYERGNLEAAFADYNRALAFDQRNASAHNNRGNAHRDLGNLDAALADYTRAIELDPRHIFAYSKRGNILQSRGNLDAALVDFNRAIEFNPRSALALLARANLHRALGNLDLAFADYNRALEVDPKFALAHGNRGQILEQRGDLTGARAALARAIELGTTFDGHRSALQRVEAALSRPMPPVQAALSHPAPPVLAALPPTAQRRHALVIGNGAYRGGSFAALPNPVNDASDMRDALSRLGFQVEFGADLDRNAMDLLLVRFARAAAGADIVVAYTKSLEA